MRSTILAHATVADVPDTTFYRQYWGSGALGHSDKTVTWKLDFPGRPSRRERPSSTT
jgi:hypothetical protein